MGTNYYFIQKKERVKHIGKASAAGWWCHNCNVPLVSNAVNEDPWKNRERLYGANAIHYSSSQAEKCFICNTPVPKENLEVSAAGEMLGFNKKKRKKVGVTSVLSFTWAIELADFSKYSQSCKIENEYEDKILDFSEVLSKCPIQFYHLVGKYFS